MKTITLIIFLFSFFATKAQLKQTAGISGGFSVSNILYKKAVDNPAEYRIGHLHRFNYEIEFFDQIFFSTGVVLWEKGFKNQVGGAVDYIKADITQRYLIIPLGLGFMAGDRFYVKASIQAHIGILVDYESFVQLYANNNKYEENTFRETEDYTRFDLSISPSLRFGYRIDANIGIFIEGAATLSLNQFMNTRNIAFSNPVNNYGFGSMIGIDYQF